MWDVCTDGKAECEPNSQEITDNRDALDWNWSAEATHWHITDTLLLNYFTMFLSGKMKRNSSSLPPSLFLSFRFLLLILILSHYPSNLIYLFICHQIFYPSNKGPRGSRCVPQSIGEINPVYAPGTTAWTGKSSLCSSHPDDFLFKIHLGGSCVIFIFHPGLLAHSALNNNWPPWGLWALLTVGMGGGEMFLGDGSPVIICNPASEGLQWLLEDQRYTYCSQRFRMVWALLQVSCRVKCSGNIIEARKSLPLRATQRHWLEKYDVCKNNNPNQGTAW